MSQFGDFAVCNLGTPAAAASGISVVGSAARVNTTITVPAHANGDILILCESGALDSATPPALRSGWSNLDSGSAFYDAAASTVACRLSWIISDGTISSLTVASNFGGIVVVVRGGTSVIGNMDFASVTDTSTAVPALAGLSTAGTSMLITNLFENVVTAVGSPYTFVNARYSYLANNTNSSAPSANLTHSSDVNIAWIVEVKP